MTAEVREEALDICITAVEKYATDMEKCTQVGGAPEGVLVAVCGSHPSRAVLC